MLEILITGIAFILIFSILILVHEFGHFITAKKSGVKVEEFGMGLPPRAITLWKDKTGTIYSLNWIPFGGFVRMLGEDDASGKAKNDPGSFSNQSLWKRMLIVTAGVIMNFVLAIVMLTIVFTAGFYPLAIVDDAKVPINSYLIQRESFAKSNGTLQKDQTTAGVIVDQVEPDSVAAQSGFQSGDIILELDGVKTSDAAELVQLVRQKSGQSMRFMVERAGATQDITVASLPNQAIGLFLRPEFSIHPVQFAFPYSVVKASEEVARQSYITLILAKNVVVNLVEKMTVPEGVAGPVGIVQMTNTFVKLGIIPVLIFVALLSISLGVLNIMPFPALDGGRFLFMLVELITRKKPNARLETIIHGIGFALLMLLILAVTWNDIMRLVQG